LHEAAWLDTPEQIAARRAAEMVDYYEGLYLESLGG